MTFGFQQLIPNLRESASMSHENDATSTIHLS